VFQGSRLKIFPLGWYSSGIAVLAALDNNRSAYSTYSSGGLKPPIRSLLVVNIRKACFLFSQLKHMFTYLWDTNSPTKLLLVNIPKFAASFLSLSANFNQFHGLAESTKQIWTPDVLVGELPALRSKARKCATLYLAKKIAPPKKRDFGSEFSTKVGTTSTILHLFWGLLRLQAFRVDPTTTNVTQVPGLSLTPQKKVSFV